MKHKHKISYIVISVFAGIAILQFQHSAKAPSITPSQPTSTNNTNNRPAPKHNKPVLKTAKQNKQYSFTSPTLQSNPVTKEVPYYLLSTVNDPYYSDNWAFESVQAQRAWDLSTGSSDVTVAVIDTGFTLNHEDLAGKWATNSGEIGTTQNGDRCWTGSSEDKADNNCDDDDNGYADDWRGFDFINIDNSPQAGEINPGGEGTEHATMVSGVIASKANNGIGSTGIDQNAIIMPLQVFSDDAEAYTSEIVAAIDYATDNGADVINLSLGTNEYDAPLLSAIQRAIANGVLVVAASGNCALNDEPFCNNLTAPGRMTYPALYSEVVAVGATNQNGTRASYSSYGSELDLVAPGSAVGPMPIYKSDGSTNGYATASGTSFSSPLVAGIAALLKAQNPSVTPDQLVDLLTESSDKLPGMNGNNYTNELGTGQANAHKATLLNLAKTQTNLLGSRELSPREPAIGNIWRAAVGNINIDEYILVGCRVASASFCSASVENGSIYSFDSTSGREKADSLQYIFIKGNAVPVGTWNISVHSNEYASSVISLSR